MAQGESAMELDEPAGELVLGGAAAEGNAEAQHEAAGSSDSASAADSGGGAGDLLLHAGGAEAAVAPPLAERLGSLQRSGLGWLCGVYHGPHRGSCRGGILGDGMGMGKTVQALTLTTPSSLCSMSGTRFELRLQPQLHTPSP